MNARLPIAVLFAASIAAAGLAAPAATIVVLPFENVSGVESGQKAIEDRMTKVLQAKGWTPADEIQIRKLLETERVRYLDSLEESVRKKVVESSGASAIVSGTLFTYTEGHTPVVAVSARMVRADGTLAWADVAAMSADDTEELLGFGRQSAVEGVAHEAVRQLMRTFPSPGAESLPVRGKSKPLLKSGPASVRAAELDPSRPHRVCVLPFENQSGLPEAARVVADVLAVRMAAEEGFEVVEPATLRAAALKARVASFRNIASEDLARLAPVVGTTLFLRGTIFRYVDGARSGSATPELQMEMTLVDVQTPRVLWTAQHDRKGTDYVGFLMRGAVSNGVSLTDRVVSEMIHAEAHGPAANGKATAGRKKLGEPHEATNNPCTRDADRGDRARCDD